MTNGNGVPWPAGESCSAGQTGTDIDGAVDAVGYRTCFHDRSTAKKSKPTVNDAGPRPNGQPSAAARAKMKVFQLMDTERPSPSPDAATTKPVGYPQFSPSSRRCSLPELLLIAAVAAGGACGLVRLAYHVTSAPPQTNDGLILQQYARSIWLHPAFLELAHRPSELAECQSCEAYRRYAEARHLQNAWYLITIKGVQINGEIVILPVIRRPYEMSESYFAEFLGVLAVADGKRPDEPWAYLATAKVNVIPPALVDKEPRAVVDELRRLDDAPAP